MTSRYPTIIVHNTKTDRYHPMPFQYYPFPGGPGHRDLESSYRFKSIGHHTEGFATLEKAIAHVKSKPELVLDGGMLEWTGDETPAAVLFFDKAWLDGLDSKNPKRGA